MFWNLTLRQFELLAERHNLKTKREDRRAGTVTAMIYNANRNTDYDPHGKDWMDFFPEWKPEPEEQSEEEMFQTMMQFAKRSEGLTA